MHKYESHHEDHCKNHSTGSSLGKMFAVRKTDKLSVKSTIKVLPMNLLVSNTGTAKHLVKQKDSRDFMLKMHVKP